MIKSIFPCSQWRHTALTFIPYHLQEMGQMLREGVRGLLFLQSLSLPYYLFLSVSGNKLLISDGQGDGLSAYLKILREYFIQSASWHTEKEQSLLKAWRQTQWEPKFLVTTNAWTIKIWSVTDCQQLQQVHFAIYECSSNRWIKDVQCTTNLELLIIQQLLVWHWLQFNSLSNWAQMEKQTCPLQQTLHKQEKSPKRAERKWKR